MCTERRGERRPVGWGGSCNAGWGCGQAAGESAKRGSDERTRALVVRSRFAGRNLTDRPESARRQSPRGRRGLPAPGRTGRCVARRTAGACSFRSSATSEATFGVVLWITARESIGAKSRDALLQLGQRLGKRARPAQRMHLTVPHDYHWLHLQNRSRPGPGLFLSAHPSEGTRGSRTGTGIERALPRSGPRQRPPSGWLPASPVPRPPSLSAPDP